MIHSINLLGSLRICADQVIKVPKKARGVLALLAMAALDGEAISRERLSTMLWPYQGTEQARHSLRNCLLELRKALRGDATQCLITDFANCRLDVPTDVAAFARLAMSDNQGDLAAAAALYRGDFLDDFWIHSEPFDEWLRDERELWRVRAMAVLTKLARLATANADHPAAIDAARRLVQIDTLNEGNQRLLMGTLDAAGQRNEAARQFRRCRETLRAELGVDPERETKDLVEKMFVPPSPCSGQGPALVVATIGPGPGSLGSLGSPMKMALDAARAQIREMAEATRVDHATMARVLARLERIITVRRVAIPELQEMREQLKERMSEGDPRPAPSPPAPSPRGYSNGAAGGAEARHERSA